jgi:hypothetical protein
LITDSRAAPEELDAIRGAGVEVRVADASGHGESKRATA